MFSAPLRRLVLHNGLALLSAILLLLIFPKFDLRWLAPLALAPILFAVARTPEWWVRFLIGWSSGTFYWFFLCTWIQFVLEVHGGMGRWGGWACFLLFSVLKGLHMAVFALLAGPLMKKPWAVPAVAALWTGLERTHATFGFTWLDLGNAGIDMSLPLRLAPFAGVYGVSFVFAVLGAAVACVALRYPRMRLAPLVALPGLWLLPAIPQNVPARKSALIVQPNIDPEAVWTLLLQERTERELATLSDGVKTPLVIWPEMPAPLDYYADEEFRGVAAGIAQSHGYFLFSTIAFRSPQEPLNSAVLLGPDGGEIGRYDKIGLVPFGEYVPPLFGFVNRITKEAGDFVPGESVKTLAAGEQKLGVFICYEAAFPDLVRQFTRLGATVLVNMSNDGYFGQSAARQQHLLISRMRAIENRRFLIRATNDGITAVVDPAGRIVKELPPYRELAVVAKYGEVRETTFYARHGDWFAWSCVAIGVALAAAAMRR